MTSPTRLSTYTTLLTRTTPTPRSERFQVFLTSLTGTLRAASFGHYLTIDSTAAPTSPVLAQSRQAADALLYEVLVDHFPEVAAHPDFTLGGGSFTDELVGIARFVRAVVDENAREPPPEFWVTTSTASRLHRRRHSVHPASSSQENSDAGEASVAVSASGQPHAHAQVPGYASWNPTSSASAQSASYQDSDATLRPPAGSRRPSLRIVTSYNDTAPSSKSGVTVPGEILLSPSTAVAAHTARPPLADQPHRSGGSGGGSSAGAKLRPAPYAFFKRRSSTRSAGFPGSSSSPRPARPTSTPPPDTGSLSMTSTSAAASRGARSERGSRSAVDSSARPTKWPLPLDALYLEQAWHGSRALEQTIAQGLQLTQQLSGQLSQLSQLAPRRIPTPAPTHLSRENATPAIILTPAGASPPSLPPVQPRSPRMGALDMTRTWAMPERPAPAYEASPVQTVAAEQRQSHNSGSTLSKVLRGS